MPALIHAGPLACGSFSVNLAIRPSGGQLQAAVAGTVLDLGSHQARLGTGCIPMCYESAEVDVDEGVTVHHQHRVGADLGPAGSEGAAGAERLRLAQGDEREARPSGTVLRHEALHLLRQMAQGQHHAPDALGLEPAQEVLEEWPAGHWCQYLGAVGHGRPEAGAETAGQEHEVQLAKPGRGAQETSSMAAAPWRWAIG